MFQSHIFLRCDKKGVKAQIGKGSQTLVRLYGAFPVRHIGGSGGSGGVGDDRHDCDFCLTFSERPYRLRLLALYVCAPRVRMYVCERIWRGRFRWWRRGRSQDNTLSLEWPAASVGITGTVLLGELLSAESRCFFAFVGVRSVRRPSSPSFLSDVKQEYEGERGKRRRRRKGKEKGRGRKGTGKGKSRFTRLAFSRECKVVLNGNC